MLKWDRPPRMIGSSPCRRLALGLCLGLSLTAAAPADATFPGRNGTIAFQNDFRGGIYTIEADGSHRREINSDGFEPSWSPSGRRILFALGTRRDSELATMRADGSHVVVLTDDRASQWEPVWSPSGDQIVFREGRARSSSGALYVMDADGRHRSRIVAHGESPDWSVPVAAGGPSPAAPAGRIAYTGPEQPPCFGGLVNFTINPDGSGETELPFTCSAAFGPSWSPDGEQLAFAAYVQSEEAGTALSDVFIGDPLGASSTRLTDRRGYDLDPAWAPDGRSIVLATDQPETGLQIVDPAAPLVETPIPHTSDVHASRPDWGPR